MKNLGTRRPTEKKNWFVMAGYEGFANATLFPLNAINLTEAEARDEADRRTTADHAAGNLNVLWFHSSMGDF